MNTLSHSIPEPTSWTVHELEQAEFGDHRLTRRLATLVAQLSSHPAASVPQATGSWAAAKAAYRFWSSERVTPASILEPHAQQTLRRCGEHQTILVIQDTTTLDFTHHPATQDLGPIGGSSFSRGFKLHSALAISPDGLPLGLLHHHMWTRDPETVGLKHQRHQRQTADKESQRWLTALSQTQQMVPPDLQVVTVADREADIFDLFAMERPAHSHLLIRAAYSRRVEHEAKHLWPLLQQTPVAGQMTVEVGRGDEHPARQAQVRLRWTDLKLEPPGHHKQRRRLASIPLCGVLVEEIEPPEGVSAISWLLLTSLPVESWDEAVQVVEWYTRRWVSERFHHVLKSGCRVEHLQLQTKERLERAVATYCLVAWRLLWLTYAARLQPEEPCSLALTRSEWQVLYCHTHGTSRPSQTAPSLEDAVRWIGQLGGFLGRKRDGAPGVQVLWRGWRRLHDMAETWSLLHPDDDDPLESTYG